MAKKHFTQVIDDLDGSVIDDGATVQFSFDGRAYEIDLSKQNAEKMRDALRPYISAGRTAETHLATPRRTPRGRAIPTRDLADVRSWAQKNGHSITTSGRMSASDIVSHDD